MLESDQSNTSGINVGGNMISYDKIGRDTACRDLIVNYYDPFASEKDPDLQEDIQ